MLVISSGVLLTGTIITRSNFLPFVLILKITKFPNNVYVNFKIYFVYI